MNNLNALYHRIQRRDGLTVDEAWQVHKAWGQLDDQFRELRARLSVILNRLDEAAPHFRNVKYNGRGELISADGLSGPEQLEWLIKKAGLEGDGE